MLKGVIIWFGGHCNMVCGWHRYTLQHIIINLKVIIIRLTGEAKKHFLVLGAQWENLGFNTYCLHFHNRYDCAWDHNHLDIWPCKKNNPGLLPWIGILRHFIMCLM